MEATYQKHRRDSSHRERDQRRDTAESSQPSPPERDREDHRRHTAECWHERERQTIGEIAATERERHTAESSLHCAGKRERDHRRNHNLRYCTDGDSAQGSAPQQLVKCGRELGVLKGPKGDKFEVLLNFDFDIITRVFMGEQSGSGAVYRVYTPGEEER